MAFIDDIRSELQITASDISDADLNYVLAKVGEDINLACAYTIQLIINKSRGRKEIEIGTFREVIDFKALRAMKRAYLAKVSSTAYGKIEDADNIFAMDGI